MNKSENINFVLVGSPDPTGKIPPGRGPGGHRYKHSQQMKQMKLLKETK